MQRSKHTRACNIIDNYIGCSFIRKRIVDTKLKILYMLRDLNFVAIQSQMLRCSWRQSSVSYIIQTIVDSFYSDMPCLGIKNPQFLENVLFFSETMCEQYFFRNLKQSEKFRFYFIKLYFFFILYIQSYLYVHLELCSIISLRIIFPFKKELYFLGLLLPVFFVLSVFHRLRPLEQ